MPRWTSDVSVTAAGPFNGCYGHVATDAIAQSIADTFFAEAAGFIPGPDGGAFSGTAHGRTLLGVVVSDTTRFVVVLDGPSTTLNMLVSVVITKDAQSATLDVADAQVQVINSDVYIYWTSLPAVLGTELFGVFQLTLSGVDGVVVATAQVVIDRVREVVNDNASAFITDKRWSDAELLLWITDGQREIVKTKPESYPITVAFDVTNDTPRQRLDPADAYRLIRVEANASVVGSPPTVIYGDVIRIVERDVFDSFNPAWSRYSPAAPGENYFKAYCMDANDPLAFFLTPVPVSLAFKVWLTYAGVPPDLAAGTDALALSAIYIAPLVDYAVYRALTKESREGNREVADRFLRSFYAALGAHRPILMSIGQNASRPPEAAA